MRAVVQRGKLVYLTDDAHRRLIPDEKPEKIGKRPFLVVQGDFLNHSSDYTIVVSLTSAGSATKSKGVDAFLPKGEGLANSNSFAECAFPRTVRDRDIRNVFSGAYGIDIMKEVDLALCLAMDIDRYQ